MPAAIVVSCLVCTYLHQRDGILNLHIPEVHAKSESRTDYQDGCEAKEDNLSHVRKVHAKSIC